MLLIELLKLFSSQLNIDDDKFISIIANNNIKLNQKLTEEKQVKKINPIEKRSRGRPKKQCNIVTERTVIPDDVNYEIVEAISHNNKQYYLTDNGVLLALDSYKVQGVIVGNQTLMK